MDLEHYGDDELARELEYNGRREALAAKYNRVLDPEDLFVSTADLLAEKAIRDKLNEAEALPLGTRVRVSTPIRGFNRASAIEPKIGLKGVITDRDSDGDPLGSHQQPPEHHVAVKFKAVDMGYVHDSEHLWVVIYLPNYCLKVA